MTDSEKLDSILDKITDLNEKLDCLDKKVRVVESDIQEVKERVIRTDITVENEIRVNIQRVAEGHLDLSRKLNESIRLSNDVKDRQEIQDIYINMHDNKLKAL